MHLIDQYINYFNTSSVIFFEKKRKKISPFEVSVQKYSFDLPQKNKTKQKIVA